MHGLIVPYSTWTEINSSKEGHFLERFLPRSLARTLVDDRARINVLFQHGMDPSVPSKPIAKVADLRDEPTGAAYEARLLDAPYVRDFVLPALEAGELGTSSTFRVMKDELRQRPPRSEFNPRALPEVSVVEARVREVSAVTFPTNADASAGMRKRSKGGNAVGEVSLLTLTRAAAYGLGNGERWVTRSKPGEPGVIERERVYEGESPSWAKSSTEDPYWLLRR
jgi:HK97 family phage prohead protease